MQLKGGAHTWRRRINTMLGAAFRGMGMARSMARSISCVGGRHGHLATTTPAHAIAALASSAHAEDQTEMLSRLVGENFPQVEYAFAYGSGVMYQPGLYPGSGGGGSNSGAPMVDLMFAVDDARKWHVQVGAVVHTFHACVDAAGG